MQQGRAELRSVKTSLTSLLSGSRDRRLPRRAADCSLGMLGLHARSERFPGRRQAGCLRFAEINDSIDNPAPTFFAFPDARARPERPRYLEPPAYLHRREYMVLANDFYIPADRPNFVLSLDVDSAKLVLDGNSVSSVIFNPLSEVLSDGQM
jgi:hypothetical protein